MDVPLLDVLVTEDHAMDTTTAKSKDASLTGRGGERVLCENSHVIDLIPSKGDMGREHVKHVGRPVLLDIADHLAAGGLGLLVDPLRDRLVLDAVLGEGSHNLVAELLEAVGLVEVPHEVVAREDSLVVLELAAVGEVGGDLIELCLDLIDLVVLELGQVEGHVGLAVGEVDLAVGALLKDDVDEGTLDHKTHGLLNLEVDVEADGVCGGHEARCKSENNKLVHFFPE